jgi:ankyrin repeat protein
LLLILLLGSLISIPAWRTYRDIRQRGLNRALIAAIKREDVSAGLAALNAGADPNSREDTSKPLSFWQSLRRMFSRMWTHRKSDSMQVSQSGWPALILALVQDEGDTNSGKPVILSPLIQALVARGANINVRVRDYDNLTPLLIAVQYEPDSTVEVLLDRGADVNAMPGTVGDSALMYAILDERTEVVKMLLMRGADVNDIDNDTGKTALQLAKKQGFTAIVRLLKQAGAKE